MKLLQRLLRILLFLIVAGILLWWGYSKYAAPKYSGTLEIINISENVTVYYDDTGVPHINA